MAKKGNAAPDKLLVELGERIREAREHARMTQIDLAEAAGISQSFVWRMETGRQNLLVRNLSRVALALGVPMSALLEGIAADPSTLGVRRYEWKAGSDVRAKKVATRKPDVD